MNTMNLTRTERKLTTLAKSVPHTMLGINPAYAGISARIEKTAGQYRAVVADQFGHGLGRTFTEAQASLRAYIASN